MPFPTAVTAADRSFAPLGMTGDPAVAPPPAQSDWTLSVHPALCYHRTGVPGGSIAFALFPRRCALQTQRWRPAPSAGSLVGILGLLLCAGGIAGLLLRTLPATAGNRAALFAVWGGVAALAAVGGALAVLLWGYLTLSYTLDDRDGSALILRWAWRRVRIPLEEIEYLGPARPILAATTAPDPQAGSLAPFLWPWPGYYLGALRDEALGRIRLFATLPPRRQLLVCSARGSFGISPDRPAQLMARYQELREAAAAQPPAAGLFPPLTSRPPLPAAALEDDEETALPPLAGAGQRAFDERTAGPPPALFQDRPSVALILAGGALVAAMVWFIVLRWDAVPQTLPLHYNATGEPDRIGTPREILILPLITALVAVANIALAWSVVRFDRFAARLLLSGTCLVQTVAWVALMKLF